MSAHLPPSALDVSTPEPLLSFEGTSSLEAVLVLGRYALARCGSCYSVILWQLAEEERKFFRSVANASQLASKQGPIGDNGAQQNPFGDPDAPA